MALGLWCAEKVMQCGGVLEHPADSRLFEAAGLPVPNSPDATRWMYTLYVEQRWFGYASRKPTWVFVCGVPKAWLPPVPFRLVERAIAPAPGMSQAARSRTMPAFARWLCQVARLTYFS